MSAIIKFLTFVLLFSISAEVIDSLLISKQLTSRKAFDVLDISRSELSKILGRKQLRTTRKLVSKQKLSNVQLESPHPRQSKPEPPYLDKQLMTQKVVFNFTDSSMKLVSSDSKVTQMSVKLDQTLGSDEAIDKCRNSLQSRALNKNIDQIRDICSAIYSVYCGINCRQNIIKRKSV